MLEINVLIPNLTVAGCCAVSTGATLRMQRLYNINEHYCFQFVIFFPFRNNGTIFVEIWGFRPSFLLEGTFCLQKSVWLQPRYF